MGVSGLAAMRPPQVWSHRTLPPARKVAAAPVFQGGSGGGDTEASHLPHLASQFCHSPAGTRNRHSDSSGPPWTLRCFNDHDLPPRHEETRRGCKKSARSRIKAPKRLRETPPKSFVAEANSSKLPKENHEPTLTNTEYPLIFFFRPKLIRGNLAHTTVTRSSNPKCPVVP